MSPLGSFAVAAAVGPNVAIVVRQAHARRKTFLVVGHVEVPVVRRGAHAAWDGRCGLRKRKRGLRRGVAVVRRALPCHSAHRAGTTGVVATPPRTPRDVRGGPLIKVATGCPLEGSGDVVDRVSESFVEEPGLNHTHLLQIVFHQHVEVLCVGWFEVRIPLGELRIGCGVINEVWGNITEVGPCDAHSIRPPQDRVGSEPILSLHAGEYIGVAVVLVSGVTVMGSVVVSSLLASNVSWVDSMRTPACNLSFPKLIVFIA